MDGGIIYRGEVIRFFARFGVVFFRRKQAREWTHIEHDLASWVSSMIAPAGGSGPGAGAKPDRDSNLRHRLMDQPDWRPGWHWIRNQTEQNCSLMEKSRSPVFKLGVAYFGREQ